MLDGLPDISTHEEVRRATRLIFNLDQPGLSVTDRRKQMHASHGPADRWMTRATAYRVVLGLLNLGADRAADPRLSGVIVNAVSISLRWPYEYVSRYEVTLYGPGPHFVPTSLTDYESNLFSMSLDIRPEPGTTTTLQAVHDTYEGLGRYAVVVNADAASGDACVFTIRQKCGRYTAMRRRVGQRPAVLHRCVHPMDVLRLEIDAPLRDGCHWEVVMSSEGGAEQPVDHPETGSSEIRTPTRGARYVLRQTT